MGRCGIQMKPESSFSWRRLPRWRVISSVFRRRWTPEARSLGLWFLAVSDIPLSTVTSHIRNKNNLYQIWLEVDVHAGEGRRSTASPATEQSEASVGYTRPFRKTQVASNVNTSCSHSTRRHSTAVTAVSDLPPLARSPGSWI
ncbi:mCG54169 [Mus musculus]|nr:mCG54169 [Mus musculus]BAB31903.1 unnamed protein product [Mus musculus]